MDDDRPPAVAAEIAGLPPLGTPECEEYIRLRGASLRPETLVHVIRAGAAAGDTSLFDLCGRLLLGRRGDDGRWSGGHCEAIIMSLAKFYGFHTDPTTLDEYRGRCHTELWMAIYAGHGAKPFWECRFGLCLKQKCIEVARAVGRQRQREREQFSFEDMNETRGETATPGTLDNTVLGHLTVEALTAAIRRLPPRQAQAALLAWVEGRPIDSDIPTSVKSVMGISGSAVNQHLAQARANLRKDPVVRAIAKEKDGREGRA